MHRIIIPTLVLFAVIAVVYNKPALSQENPVGVVVDLSTIDCRAFLKMSGDERDFTLVFFHGFMSAKRQDMIFNGPVLAEATDQVIDHCIDNPSENLLKVFKAKRP